jgi:hypothetical protein
MAVMTITASADADKGQKIYSKKLKEKKLGHLGDFVQEFASDSGNVPNC